MAWQRQRQGSSGAGGGDGGDSRDYDDGGSGDEAASSSAAATGAAGAAGASGAASAAQRTGGAPLRAGDSAGPKKRPREGEPAAKKPVAADKKATVTTVTDNAKSKSETKAKPKKKPSLSDADAAPVLEEFDADDQEIQYLEKKLGACVVCAWFYR